MKKILVNALTILSVLMIVWLILSFVDVNIHNNPANEHFGEYALWNLFKILWF